MNQITLIFLKYSIKIFWIMSNKRFPSSNYYLVVVDDIISVEIP